MLLPNGTHAQSVDAFNPAADGSVYAFAQQRDGKILVGGAFSTLGGQPHSGLARLNIDGTVDSGFNAVVGGGYGSAVYSLAVQADGKILVGGAFNTLGGQPCNALGRLNADGSVDNGFSAAVGGNHNPTIYALAVQPGGKILVGGGFTALGGQPRNSLGLLNPDGSPDLGFNPGVSGGGFGNVFSLAMQRDGKILVGGDFTTLAGQSCAYLGRLSADGSIDNGFTPAPGGGSYSILWWGSGFMSVLGDYSPVYSLAVQRDGKIVVGGVFTTLCGQPRSCLGRLNADGTLDTGFNPGVGPEPAGWTSESGVFSLSLQADGKVLMDGWFTTLGGQARTGIGRLNPDGTVDEGFNPTVDGGASSLALQADGKVLVGGWFTALGGQARADIGRLMNTDPATESLSWDSSSITWLRGSTSPEVTYALFETSINGTDWLALGFALPISGGWQLNHATVPPGAPVRARGYAAGGLFGSSSWLVESQGSNTNQPPARPAIVSPPQGQSVVAGMNVAFSVVALGTEPLSYQWQFKGGDLAGATNSLLSLTNVTGANAGDYQVVVSNLLGSATSKAATLFVDPQFAYWVGRGDGSSWNDAQNWSAKWLPCPTNDVVIAGVGTNVTIVRNGEITVRSIQCSASLSVSGGNLNLTQGASQLAGNLTVEPGRAVALSGSNTMFTVRGGAAIDGASLYVSDGAVLSLPGVRNYSRQACQETWWQASGAGSVLELPGLTNVSLILCGWHHVSALAGGQVLLTNLVTLSDGAFNVLADGTNSVIDLSRWSSYAGRSGYALVDASNGGTVRMPQLVDGGAVTLTLRAGATVNYAQLTQLYSLTVVTQPVVMSNLTRINSGSLSVSGGAVLSLPGLTNIDGASLYVSDGAVLSLPGVRNYSRDYPETWWQASGAGSRLVLPSLTNAVWRSSGWHHVCALQGGRVEVAALAALNGYADILADGTGSVVDLSNLASFNTNGAYYGNLQARIGGAILCPSLVSVVSLNLLISTSGSISTAQLRSVRNCSITIDGVTVDLSGLTDPAGTTFNYLNGGQATFPPAVDLAVMDIRAPAAALAAQPVQITWTVRNLGTNSASGTRSDAVYLSDNLNPNTNCFIGQFPVANDLPPGAERAYTNTIILPANASGNFYPVVVADSLFQVFEGIEPSAKSNNTFVASTPITISAPDLQAQILNALPSAQFGQSVLLTYKVWNSGAIPTTAAWRERVYLSPTAAVTAQSVVLAEPSSAGPLAAGASYTNTLSVTLPLNSSLAAGAYYLVVVADQANAVLESNEANNSAFWPLTLSLPPLPDLVPGAVAGPGLANPGQTITVTWAVTNIGPVAATNAWAEALSLTNTGTGKAVLLARSTFADVLSAGAFLLRTQSVQVPVTGLAGDLHLLVEVNALHDLVESNESNNVAVAETVTTVPAALTVQLPVTSIPENASDPGLTALVSRNGDISSPLTVTLASSDTNKLAAPPSLTFAANQATASFRAIVQWDHVVTPNKLVTLTASALGFADGQASVTVLNVDQPQLTLTLDNPVVMESFSLSARVSRSGALDQPLTVTLGSCNAANLLPPASVTIPAGLDSIEFTVPSPDNTRIEGTRTCTLSAAAPGYSGASVSVQILDNDWPGLTLSLNTTNVSEGAGADAVVGTITRGIVSQQALVIGLTSSDTNALLFPPSVVIPAGQASQAFTLTPLNDSVANPSRVVTLYAYLWDAANRVYLNPPATNTLTITDDDGPTLTLTLGQSLLRPGSNTTALVALNGLTNDTPVDVSLTSSDTNQVFVVPTVTIPAGTNAAVVLVQTLTSAAPQGTRSVTLTAAATNFNSGSATLELTDLALPDLVVAQAAGPATAFTKQMASLTFRVANQGLAPMTNAIRQRVFLSDDPYPGNDILVGDYVFNPSAQGLLPGQWFEQTISAFMPQTPGDYWVVVTADVDGTVAEVDKANNTRVSAAPLHVSAEYSATVQTSVTIAPVNSDVPLHGWVTMADGLSPEGKLVNIFITVRNIQRVISALARADGTFDTVFHPLPGEAGSYTAGAAPPGLTNAPVQAQFTLLGATFDPGSLNLKVAESGSVSGWVTVRNPGDAPLSGLSVSAIGLPANLAANVSLENNILSGLGSVRLAYAFTANALSPSPASFSLRLTSAEGVALDLPVTVTVEPLRPRLVAYPAELMAGMVRDSQRLVEFAVVNEGGAASGPLAVLLPLAPWMSLVTTNPQPSLDPGQTNRLTLLLTPTADMTLGEYKGNLAINGAAASLSVPFNFRAVSDSLGSLLITATDEYTYYAEGAPPVTNAAVTVSDAVSGTIVTNGVTDANGEFFVPAIAEGYYNIEVTADNHNAYKAVSLLLAGQTNDVETFMQRQTVQYIWNVDPTDVEDQTKLTVETVFEANVPAPVVTIEPSRVDISSLKHPGDSMTVEFVISNHGLIAVTNVQLNLPSDPFLNFQAPASKIGSLAAGASLRIPVTVSFPNPSPAQVSFISQERAQQPISVKQSGATGGDEGFNRLQIGPMSATQPTFCSTIYTNQSRTTEISSLPVVKAKMECSKEIVLGMITGRTQSVDRIMIECPPSNRVTIERGDTTLRVDPFTLPVDPTTGLPFIQTHCKFAYVSVMIKSPIMPTWHGSRSIPLPCIDPPLGGWDYMQCGTATASADCACAGKSPYFNDCLGTFGDTPTIALTKAGDQQIWNTFLVMMGACTENSKEFIVLSGFEWGMEANEAPDISSEPYPLSNGTVVEATVISSNYKFIGPTDIGPNAGLVNTALANSGYAADGWHALGPEEAYKCLQPAVQDSQFSTCPNQIYEGSVAVPGCVDVTRYEVTKQPEMGELIPWPDGQQIDAKGNFKYKGYCKTGFDSFNFKAWNGPIESCEKKVSIQIRDCRLTAHLFYQYLCKVMQDGYVPISFLTCATCGCATTPSSGDSSSNSSGGGGGPSMSTPWYCTLGLCTPSAPQSPAAKGLRQTSSASGAGFSRPMAATAEDGVCARVRIRLDQDAVLTRDAFKATLELINSSGESLQNIGVDLLVKPPGGAGVPELFGIGAPALDSLTAVDGTGSVANGTTGKASWIIIPSADAAPQVATRYVVSGQLRYTQGGMLVTVPLAEVPITVNPSPRLTLTYFHQRDVFSDDPFTDVIEPSIPYSLAVMVQNKGYGQAKNFRITSAQPKIVDNEKGLLIDFQIIATEVAGQNMTPSLTADFGSIAPGQTAIARWLMTSSLQGLFIDYKATYENVDILGRTNSNLSLIDGVTIHEMNHMVRATGAFEDGKPDFLVNDVPDVDDMPDTVYLSDGSVSPVAVVREASAGIPTAGNLQVTLTAALPSSGFGYLHVPDPQGASGAPAYRLAAVVRSDGTNLPPDNFWQTDRTFIGMGRRPIRENILHLFDFNSTGQYTLVYEPVAPPVAPPSSQVAGLPANVFTNIGVSWSGSSPSGGPLRYDIFVSIDEGPFQPWLQNTALLGAFYNAQLGHRYAFYSVAIDSTGQREAPPGTPDAVTTASLINTAPVLGTLPPMPLTLEEGQIFTFQVPATDAEAPPQILSYSLANQPAGMTISPAGLITWPTTELDGPGTNVFRVTVSDNGQPPLSVSAQMSLVVREVNQPPWLAPLTNRIVQEGQLLVITNRAGDSDWPLNTLRFQLLPPVALGASLDPTNGVFSWQPTETQGPSTNLFTVVVTDNGVPSLSATQQFTVVVRDTLSDFGLSLGRTNVIAPETSSVPLVLNSGLELTNITFRLEPAAGPLTNLSFAATAGEVVGISVLQAYGSQQQEATLSLDPAQMTPGARPLAVLNFTAQKTGRSAQVPLHLWNVAGVDLRGRWWTNAAAGGGGVIVVDGQPILESGLGSNHSFTLVLFGETNRAYALEAATGPAAGDWTNVLSCPLTNRCQSFSFPISPDGAARFFRAREQ